MRYSGKELLKNLPDKHKVDGNLSEKHFDNIKTIFEADEFSLTWLNPSRTDTEQLINNTLSQLIICSLDFDSSKFKNTNKCFIKVESPKLVFLRIVGQFFKTPVEYGIHKSAVIHPEAVVHPKSYVGPNTYIGKSTIGEGTIIYGNCYLYDNTRIGSNVIINACTVIGADGFGYARNENNILEKFPHIGGVIIEDNVEIGANTCIDKGTLGDTIIKKGVKIDNLVHIAHNVVIGENTMIIANSMIGGSTTIGANSWIAPSVSLRDAIVIGENVTVGMGSTVTKNIPAGETWAGSPSKELSLLKQQLKKIDKL